MRARILPRLIQGATALALVVVALQSLPVAAADAVLKEPVFTAPEGYVESAQAGYLPCKDGMKALVTHAEFRKFGFRNEVWPQEDGVDLSDASWSAARATHVPVVNFAFAGKARRGFQAQVYVLVDGDGQVLDKLVTCSTAPAYNDALLALIDGFRFEPSRYKGRGLHSVMPVDFEN